MTPERQPCVRQQTETACADTQNGLADPANPHWTPSIDQALANRLLAKLQQAERSLLLDHAELVELDGAQVLVRAGQGLAHAYFPTNCMISLLTTQPAARAFEVGQIGFEGVLGASSALGVTASAFDAVVTGAGQAWRIPLAVLRRQCLHSRFLSVLMVRFLYIQLEQMGALAACGQFHALEQRLARLLLMCQDRMRVPDLEVTHEGLARVMGVRRASVTMLAGAFQKRHLIRHSRGHMVIVDRPGLQATSCPCHAQDLAFYEQVMSEKWPSA
ncbi:Crp/Fnr family transcriptional regulator [Hydrogenophaga soli]